MHGWEIGRDGRWREPGVEGWGEWRAHQPSDLAILRARSSRRSLIVAM
jgi:hypothetical protein